MNYEIRRVANGYMLTPPISYNRGDGYKDEEIYVFESYARLIDKLQELLERKNVQS